MYHTQTTEFMSPMPEAEVLSMKTNSLEDLDLILPFNARVLSPSPGPKNGGDSERISETTTTLAEHLPATYRTRGDHISIPSFDDFDFLQRELSVKRLDDIQEHLWTVGRPMPPRPLHYQVMLSRDIVITENMDLHLVWSGTRIFIKPIPSYLLDPTFWANYIVRQDGTAGQQKLKEVQNPEYQQIREELSKCARGFLFTYTALIAYESDFHIAHTAGLLPSSVTWESWKVFSRELLQNHHYSAVSPRFWYGELRLSRLNSIYRWRKGLLWRGYSKVASHISYEDLLRDNFALLTSILGYVVIVLTAMQLGLATDKLTESGPFQNASYGLTVFAILAPLIIGFIIIVIVLGIVVYNWMVTKTYEKRRFRDMGLLPDWRDKDSERGRADSG